MTEMRQRSEWDSVAHKIEKGGSEKFVSAEWQVVGLGCGGARIF